MIYRHIGPGPFHWRNCCMTLFVGCFAVLYLNIRKTFFVMVCQQRENCTKEVQTAHIMSGVWTGMIDKNSYHPKNSHNCVCQRTSFSCWSLNHLHWYCVLSSHFFYVFISSSSWLLFYLYAVLLMIHSEQSITSSNKFQTNNEAVLSIFFEVPSQQYCRYG